MNRILGIDIDGVITDEGEADNNIWHKALCNYFKENLNREKNVYSFVEAYGLSEREMNEFINDQIENIYAGVKPYNKVSTILNSLIDKEFTIYLITARHDEFRPVTEKWLEKYSIPYHSLYHEDDKAPLAVKKNIELFIEDNYNNASEIVDQKIPVLLVNKYHNQGKELIDGIKRVDGWQEISQFITEYYSLNSL